MITLDQDELRSLFLGSAFFSCGGGVPRDVSMFVMSRLGDDAKVQLASFDDLSTDDWLCTAYAIGASGGTKKNYDALVNAVRQLEESIGAPIRGVIPGEIGSEINALWVAGRLGIPVIDTDMVGGRAVPEEQMDVYGIHDLSPTPVAVTNGDGDVLLVRNASDLAVLEAVYRAFAVASGGYCYVAGRPLRPFDARAILPPGTVSRALQTGDRLRRCYSAREAADALEEVCGSSLIGAGTVVDNKLRHDPGFLSGVLHIVGAGQFGGLAFDLHYKNEFTFLACDGRYVCSVPDLISLLDASTLMPISISQIAAGIDVLVMGTPALTFWHSEHGIALFGPARFGFDYDFQPLGSGKRGH